VLSAEPAVGETVEAKQPSGWPVPIGPVIAPVVVQLANGGALQVDLPGDRLCGCPAQCVRACRCQGYGSGCGECPVEDNVTANFDPIAMQGTAVLVAAGQLGAAALELPGDVRSQQADRAGRGEPLVKEHITADFHPFAMQSIAVLVAAGEHGGAAAELSSDVRA